MLYLTCRGIIHRPPVKRTVTSLFLVQFCKVLPMLFMEINNIIVLRVPQCAIFNWFVNRVGSFVSTMATSCSHSKFSLFTNYITYYVMCLFFRFHSVDLNLIVDTEHGFLTPILFNAERKVCEIWLLYLS